VAPASSARARRDPGVRKDAGRRPATSRTSPHVHPLWPQRNRQCKRAHCALAASIFTGCADECLRPAVVVLQSVRNPNLRMGPFENSTCCSLLHPPPRGRRRARGSGAELFQFARRRGRPFFCLSWCPAQIQVRQGFV
jgi:hypothetical protein